MSEISKGAERLLIGESDSVIEARIANFMKRKQVGEFAVAAVL